jgi:hypothetical protein
MARAIDFSTPKKDHSEESRFDVSNVLLEVQRLLQEQQKLPEAGRKKVLGDSVVYGTSFLHRVPGTIEPGQVHSEKSVELFNEQRGPPSPFRTSWDTVRA